LVPSGCWWYGQYTINAQQLLLEHDKEDDFYNLVPILRNKSNNQEKKEYDYARISIIASMAK
jgi:hypothetical protein